MNPNYDPSPLAPEVFIYDLNNTLKYTYQTLITQSTPTQDFNLSSLSLHLGINDDFGNAVLVIDDPNNLLTDSESIRRPSKILRQWNIQIYLGKSNTTRYRAFYGKIFDVEVIRPNTNLQQLRLSCVGWGVRLKDRYTNIKRFQKKMEDGLTLDDTDTNTRASELVKDLIQDVDHLTIESLGAETTITVNGVNVIDVKIPDLQFDNVSIATVLNYLAGSASVIWGVDPDRDLFFRDQLSSDSGFLFTNDLNGMTSNNWSGTKIGYLNRTPFSFNDSSFEGGYSILVSMRPNRETLDIDKTSTNAVYNANETNWLAIPFTPTKDNLSKIALRMSKVGTPNAGPMNISIIGDSASTPEEQNLIKSIQIPQSKLQSLTGVGEWTEISFKEPTPLVPNTKYYIMIQKYGTSGNEINFDYQTGTGTYFTSTDGATWTSQVGDFALRTYHSKPTRIILENTVAKNRFGVREETINFPNTVSAETAKTVMISVADIIGKEKRIYSDVIVTCPTDRIPLGKYCRIIDVFSGFDIRAGVVGVDISMSALHDGRLGAQTMKLKLEDWFN